MFKYSKNSLEAKKLCHPDLEKILDSLIQTYDHSIIWSYRGEVDQNAAQARGDSDLKFPRSNHNVMPARAIDIVPYPGSYKAGDKQFYFMAGLVKGIAKSLGIRIRWGGDWDGDNDFKDQKLNDLAHFELVS